jgi:hypothetical protein
MNLRKVFRRDLVSVALLIFRLLRFIIVTLIVQKKTKFILRVSRFFTFYTSPEVCFACLAIRYCLSIVFSLFICDFLMKKSLTCDGREFLYSLAITRLHDSNGSSFCII